MSGVSALLRRCFAGTVPYAADELGYGPDTEDPIVVWQGGTGLGPSDARANARIEIIDPRQRVRLVPSWAGGRLPIRDKGTLPMNGAPSSGCACSRGRV